MLYKNLIFNLQEWKLDLFKFIGIGLDGASTTVGSKSSMSTCLKKLNPFLKSIHYVAHRTNLAVLEAIVK